MSRRDDRSDDLLPLIAAWDGYGVVVRHDHPTDTWIFIALHSSVLGQPVGGTRMKVYPRLRDALRDAMRLAEGMTSKWAGLGMPFGGGKAVLAIRRPLDGDARRGLLRRYGALIESLNGGFATGADLGTTAADMATIAEATRHVLGVDRDTGTSTDPGPFTACGVFEGIRAAVAHAFGTDDLRGRSVLVQGVGGVGAPLARRLSASGVQVLLSDLDAARARALAEELGGIAVASDDALTTACDVLAPCATGGVLSEQTIPNLRCKIVCGSANNQLHEEDDADRLRKWGILYVPDYIVNAGGAMALPLMAEGLVDRDALMARVATIGPVVAEILREAADSGSTPLEAARRRVERRLAEAG